MSNYHLHILHLPPITDKKKINKISETRRLNLIRELENQAIKEYTIVEGFYDKKNTKKAIHLGHKKIVQLAKEQGLSNCIIAEDDVVFSSPKSYEYFLSQIPASYDLFCGLMYKGACQGNRITNGASGIMTLYSVHSRFYDFFLSLNPDTHIDIELGNHAYKYEYYLCQPFCVTQRGGYSFNLGKIMYYREYLRYKKLYSVDNMM